MRPIRPPMPARGWQLVTSVLARGRGCGRVYILAALLSPVVVAAQSTAESEREAMYRRYEEVSSRMRPAGSEPHWMADGNTFWYAEGLADNTNVYKVDMRANTRVPLFDVARLRQALTPLLGHEPPNRGLPFDVPGHWPRFAFVQGERAVRFTVERKAFVLQLDSYSIAPVSDAETPPNEPRGQELLSPDARWFAGINDFNIYLRSTDDGRRTPLTRDGVRGYSWDYDDYFGDEAKWSPDSRKLAVMKMDYRNVDSMPIVHWLTPKAAVEWVNWRRADGRYETNELFVVDVPSGRQVRIDVGDKPDCGILILGWRPDGAELFFLRMGRDYKKLELMAANPATGTSRTVVTETQQTYVGGWQLGGSSRYGGFYLLEDGKRFLWMSERDSWNHLYLYNSDGSLIRRLTQGEFPVERVVAVDEKNGWVYFTAHAERARPYDTHLYRVSLEGKGFTRLTEATGTHEIEFSPSKEFFVEMHSSLDRPFALELRRADGTLLQTLARQDVDALRELKWRPPDEFVVKAADGKTDLYGVLYTPYDFDPARKYPVIDFIYAGACCTDVEREFSGNFGDQAQAMAQLGFVTFRVDGRGTARRGKAFQDVVYGNVGRNEIPDHVATLRQLAGQRPWMDLSRVGITGYSWGGHFALRAMLQAPEIYRVGVAGAPDTDLNDHFPNDIESYMGEAQKNKAAYDYGSNYWLAGNLKGKLLIIHGTSDATAPFSVTMRMADALIRAGKFFDLIVVPQENHDSLFRGTPAARYAREATRRYFQEHLRPE